MDALNSPNKWDKESLKRYLVNTTELDEERIGQVASLALAHESAEDLRRFHGNTRRGTVPLAWSGHSNLNRKLGQWRSAKMGHSVRAQQIEKALPLQARSQVVPK